MEDENGNSFVKMLSNDDAFSNQVIVVAPSLFGFIKTDPKNKSKYAEVGTSGKKNGEIKDNSNRIGTCDVYKNGRKIKELDGKYTTSIPVNE